MTISKLAGLPPRKTHKNTDQLVVSDRNCGVEIELEQVNRQYLKNNLGDHWVVADDQSLRPRGQTAELKSPDGGVCGKQLVDALEAFGELKLTNPAHFSWRTGLHVHIDVRDKTPNDMQVFAVKYALLEPYIFHWMGGGRHESRFSMPWWICVGDVGAATELFSSTYKSSGRDSCFVRNTTAFSKYTSCNLAPMSKFGTIEMRHGQSTGDLEKITNYINIGLSLVETSNATDDSDQCVKMIQDFITKGPEAFMIKHLDAFCAKLLYTDIVDTPPITREILLRSTNTALHIAELAGHKEKCNVGIEAVVTLSPLLHGRSSSRNLGPIEEVLQNQPP